MVIICSDLLQNLWQEPYLLSVLNSCLWFKIYHTTTNSSSGRVRLQAAYCRNWNRSWSAILAAPSPQKLKLKTSRELGFHLQPHKASQVNHLSHLLLVTVRIIHSFLLLQPRILLSLLKPLRFQNKLKWFLEGNQGWGKPGCFFLLKGYNFHWSIKHTGYRNNSTVRWYSLPRGVRY